MKPAPNHPWRNGKLAELALKREREEMEGEGAEGADDHASARPMAAGEFVPLVSGVGDNSTIAAGAHQKKRFPTLDELDGDPEGGSGSDL